jgi:hypothetical protein
LQAGKTTLLGLAGLALAALGLMYGCGEKDSAAVNAATAAPQPTEDYRLPPELLGGAKSANGALQLYGAASPGAAVRLASPSGAQQFATADAGGVWRLTLLPSSEPRLLGLSMSDKGQVVQAVGYLFIAPDGAVARLRTGGGTQASTPTAPGLAALALDYDNQRAATLSGVSGPHETVIVRVDGVERSQARADAGGRFVAALQPLTAGAHQFDVMGATQQIHFAATVDTPQTPASAPYTAKREGQGWRIDWRTPGGGGQTTLILGPSEAGA